MKSHSRTFTASFAIILLAASTMLQAGAKEISLESISACRISVATPNDPPVINYMGVFTGRDRSLIKFDLSSIPKNAKVSKAILRLVVATKFGGNPDGIPTEVYRIAGDWDSSTVCWRESKPGEVWSNLGGDAADADGELINGKSGPWGPPYGENTANVENKENLDIDSTNLVKDWISGKFPNYGLLLASRSTNRYHFGAGENDLAAPELIVTLE